MTYIIRFGDVQRSVKKASGVGLVLNVFETIAMWFVFSVIMPLGTRIYARHWSKISNLYDVLGAGKCFCGGICGT